MPSSQQIVEQLGAIANNWRAVATAWHLVFACLLIGLAASWRPPNRLVAAVLVSPVVSVSAMAWLAGNPFNGTLFGLLAVALAATVRRLPAGPIHLASWPTLSVASALAVFGLVYPHFSPAASWLTLLLVTPVGLIPCPTLAVLIAVTLIVRHFDSKLWSSILAGAGLFYGAVGVFALGVPIDAGLIAGALVLALTAIPRRVNVERRMMKRSSATT